MKKKVIIAIVGATVGILAGLLVFINIPKDGEEVPVTDEVATESVISKTGTSSNTILDDEHTVAEFATGEYIEDKQEKETEEAEHLEAGGISKIEEDDINYVAHKTEVLDNTVERATCIVYAAAETNVYAEMSLESEILGSVDFNEKLTTYGIVDGWYVIDYDGRDGYIPEAYVSSIESKEQVKVEDITETTVIAQQSSSEKTETETVDKDTNAGAIREETKEEETKTAESTPTTPSTSSSSDNPAGLTDEQIAILDALDNEYYTGPVAEYVEPTKSLDELAAEADKKLTSEQREILDRLIVE